jgi:hypothetical protein
MQDLLEKQRLLIEKYNTLSQSFSSLSAKMKIAIKETELYQVRLSTLEENLNILRFSTKIVSLKEYQEIRKEFFYFKASLRESELLLIIAKESGDILEKKIDKIFEELDIIDSLILTYKKILPFRKKP